MTRLARALLVLVAAPAFALTAAPAAAAPFPASVEAESVRSVDTTVVHDAAASGRRAALLPPGRTLTFRLSAPATASRLVLRLRTASGATGQTPVVLVDGRRVTGLPAVGRTWHDQLVGAGASAGLHSVTVTNPAGHRRPALLVDRLHVVPAHARPAAPAPVDDAYEARIVQLVNAERAAAGLPGLTVSTCADRSAEDWSATMARTSVFGHNPSLGTVMTACGATAVGENVAYGSVTADEMVRMWMRSPGHRANVLSSRFTHLGVGAARTADGRTHATQVFLRLDSAQARASGK